MMKGIYKLYTKDTIIHKFNLVRSTLKFSQNNEFFWAEIPGDN